MTPEIKALIKKKTEERYPIQTTRIPEERWGYATGQIEAIEMMVGFTEWIRKNYTDGFDGTWHKEIEPCVYQSFTTIELLTKYIKEVLSK